VILDGEVGVWANIDKIHKNDKIINECYECCIEGPTLKPGYYFQTHKDKCKENRQNQYRAKVDTSFAVLDVNELKHEIIKARFRRVT
jgi:hypothetical protein